MTQEEVAAMQFGEDIFEETSLIDGDDDLFDEIWEDEEFEPSDLSEEDTYTEDLSPKTSAKKTSKFAQ
jgi:hypothetical protein